AAACAGYDAHHSKGTLRTALDTCPSPKTHSLIPSAHDAHWPCSAAVLPREMAAAHHPAVFVGASTSRSLRNSGGAVHVGGRFSSCSRRLLPPPQHWRWPNASTPPHCSTTACAHTCGGRRTPQRMASITTTSSTT